MDDAGYGRDFLIFEPEDQPNVFAAPEPEYRDLRSGNLDPRELRSWRYLDFVHRSETGLFIDASADGEPKAGDGTGVFLGIKATASSRVQIPRTAEMARSSIIRDEEYSYYSAQRMDEEHELSR